LRSAPRTDAPLSRPLCQFWKTQPVVQSKDALSSGPIADGPIDRPSPFPRPQPRSWTRPLTPLPASPLAAPRSKADIRQTPYPLPSDFTWDTIDVEDAGQIKELYELLTYNYVEDQEATMRFDYSAEFLDWFVAPLPFAASPPLQRPFLCLLNERTEGLTDRSHLDGRTDGRMTHRALKPPGYVKDWQVGVRVKSTGKLVAFISGIPVSLRARSKYVAARAP
jgi:glycylpeptide N-tetradecanoyltransferase